MTDKHQQKSDEFGFMWDASASHHKRDDEGWIRMFEAMYDDDDDDDDDEWLYSINGLLIIVLIHFMGKNHSEYDCRTSKPVFNMVTNTPWSTRR